MDTSVEKFYPAMYPLDEVANHMLEPLVCRLIYNVRLVPMICSNLYFPT
jgi:serine/threonine protein kinase